MSELKSRHPSPDRLAALRSQRLSAAEAAEIEGHVAECAACAQLLAALPSAIASPLSSGSHLEPGAVPANEKIEVNHPADASTIPDGSAEQSAASLTVPIDVRQPPSSSAAPHAAPERPPGVQTETTPYSPGGSSPPNPAAAAPAQPTRAESGNRHPVPPELIDHPRYRVLQLLGSGGMGTVYQAQHRLMERLVALKVINRSLVEKPAALERFCREVKAAARLSHPNIVAAYDAEQAGTVHFLVMEFVEGTTLDRLVVRQGWLPIAQACDYTRQAALGLQHAFERGMVHRDIKPQNLILTRDGHVKILDFGLANFVIESGRAGPITEFGSLLGTVDYIAPEQAYDAHSADIRADIYSLGYTLYHLLAGHPPFPSGDLVQKLVGHLQRTPRRLSELRSDVPSELLEVIDRMTAKEPSRRFQTPAEVAQALAPLAGVASVAEVKLASPQRGADLGVPVRAATVLPPTEKHPSHEGADKMRILIAEDDRISRRMLQKHLEKWGHEVVSASNGAEAWKLFEGDDFPIVISDWVMPEIDGVELVRRIRCSGRTGYVYIILLTAKSEKEDIVLGMEAGADDFVAKPFDEDELRVRLRAGERIIRLEHNLARRNAELQTANAEISAVNQRMKRDLVAAAKIQHAFLPAVLPDLPGIHFAWDYRPCEELAGDTLSVMQLDPEHVALSVVDVSGHGVSAALLSVTLSRLLSGMPDASSLLRQRLKSAPWYRPVPPAEVAAQLNRQFPWDPRTEQYFTILYGTLNVKTHEVRFVSAGHPGPVYLPHHAPPMMLEVAGFPIGLGEAQYDEQSVSLKPGDRLYLYSDGITDAMNSSDAQFGTERLLGTLDQTRELPLKESISALIRRAEEWCGAVPLKDDVSVLAVEIAPSQGH